MKRFLSALILLTLIIGCVSVSRAEVPGDVLEVYNCNEYVTLRREPNTKSEGITRVFKGDFVYFCDYASNGFYHVQFGADDGYILSGYLRNAGIESGEYGYEEPEESGEIAVGFDELPALPAYADFMKIGDPVCEIVCGDYHLVARHAIPFSDEREELLAVCYDSADRPLWTAFEVSNVVTELNAATAFIAGTAEAPYLVTFLSGKGFTARAIDGKGTLLWINNCANPQGTALETVMPGAGLTTAVDENGNIYAAGYYGESPVAIDVNGNFLWKGENPDPDSIYWPYEIQLSASGVTVLYGSCMDADDMAYAVTYDPADGHCTAIATVEIPNV